MNGTTYPYLVVRAKTDTPGGDGIVTVNGSFFGLLNMTTSYKIFVITHGISGTITSIQLIGIVNPAVNSFDLVALCGKTPLTLSGTDLVKGTVTRTSLGADHAELQLNNWNGKYLSGGTSPIGFGDHLHIYLPKQGGGTTTQYHAYGGTVEYLQPTAPPHVVELHSRGYGIALLESLVLANFQSQTPQGIFNTILDSHVNPATKQNITVTNPYQLTRSYVQPIGSSIGLYISSMHPALDIMKEITDITTAQASPGVFFVDPAENLHFVPLNSSWTTDPYPYQYPTLLAVGTNQIINNFARDVKSVRNRVHFTAVAASPGLPDLWTDYANDTDVQSNWDKERVNANNTGSLHTSGANPVALGSYSVEFDLVDNAGALLAGAFFYPKAKNLALDVSKLGSPFSPPLLEIYWRFNKSGGGGAPLSGNNPCTIFFATDATNRFEYRLASEVGAVKNISILNADMGSASQDYWYHLLIPIGPHGGTSFVSPPTLNGIPTASFTGGSQFALANVGSPDWGNINYVGVYMESGGGVVGTTIKTYVDGLRFLGGRYRITYDGSTSAYPEMREIHFFDPIAKSEDTIQNLARAELLRLKSPILRGNLHVPIIGDLVPEQQVQIKASAEGYSTGTYLRCSEFTHRFSNRGMITELKVTDDFTNSQPLSPFKLENVLLQMGENAVFNKQLYDLKTFLVDPQASPVVEHWTGSGWAAN